MRGSVSKSALVSAEMDSVRPLRDRNHLGTSFPSLQITSIGARPELREEHRDLPATRAGRRESSACVAVAVGTDWLPEDQCIICLH
jgi:hypothetical protein